MFIFCDFPETCRAKRAPRGSEVLLHHSPIVKSWSQEMWQLEKQPFCGLRLVVVYIRPVTLDFGKVLGETLDHFALLAVG